MDHRDWDARYAAAEGPLFGDTPSDHLRACLARPEMRPRRALALADGDGRNGRWLAAQGLATTAVDFSPEATRRALAADAAAGVTVTRAQADLTAWSPPADERWDLVALLFLQGPAALRSRALRVAAEAVAPGGWLALEGFAAGEGPALGPSDPAARWSAAEIAPLLAGIEIVELLTGRALLREGPRHDGAALVLRLLARATASARTAP
jgi:SAM-dependent methyltransferase